MKILTIGQWRRVGLLLIPLLPLIGSRENTMVAC